MCVSDMPGILGPRDAALNKTDKIPYPHGAYILMEGRLDNKIIHKIYILKDDAVLWGEKTQSDFKVFTFK